MTRSDWYRIFLFIHIFSVIVGIGPTFVFGRITGMGRADAPHSRFAAGVVHRLTTTTAIPVAVVIFASGLGMIWALDFDIWETGWLLAAIVLFILGFAYSVTVQSRSLKRVVAITGREDFDATDPPPELAALGRRITWGGRYLRTSASVILYLMIFKSINPL